jgi:hypothetical protein
LARFPYAKGSVCRVKSERLLSLSQCCRVQMKYKFTLEDLDLFKPAVYTICTQKLATGSWVFPTEGTNEWLCATPRKE